MENIKDSISQHNLQVYQDIARDMMNKKDGMFSFIIKVDGKFICDYVQLETFMYAETTTIKWKKTT
jgi:hypothetical protein